MYEEHYIKLSVCMCVCVCVCVCACTRHILFVHLTLCMCVQGVMWCLTLYVTYCVGDTLCDMVCDCVNDSE